MIRFRRRARAGAGHRRDDRGSLPMAMLLSVVGVSLSPLLGTVVVNQVTDTRTSAGRAFALHAAEAGMSTAVGQLRAAADGTGAGDPTSLPTGPLTGSIAPDGTQRYRVTITYRDLDGNALAIPLTAEPASADLVATGIRAATGTFGVGTRGSRTLQATYTFEIENPNITGGQIHVRGTTTDLCLDAGSAKPAAGTPVRVESCAGKPAQQLWAYRPDLTLMLVSSRTVANPLGMCLDAGTAHTAGAAVRTQRCTATTPTPAGQQWSMNDVANIAGTATAGSTFDGSCFNVGNPYTAGSPVVLAIATCNGGPDNVQTFLPDPAVGSGAAGAASKQLVNYAQGDRCLDVTNQNVAGPYLGSAPCRQATTVADIGWRQKWTLPAVNAITHIGTGRIYTTVSGTDYCLRSPGVTTGAYPQVTPCSNGSAGASLTWTVYSATGVYVTSNQIVDSSGLCLAAANPATSPAEIVSGTSAGPAISRIVMRTCDGTAWQKWNAEPDLAKPLPLTRIYER